LTAKASTDAKLSYLWGTCSSLQFVS